MDTAKTYKKDYKTNKLKSWDGYVTPTRTYEYIMAKSKPSVINKTVEGYKEKPLQEKASVVFNPYQELLKLKIEQQNAQMLFEAKSKEADRQYAKRAANIDMGVDDIQRQAQLVNKNSEADAQRILNNLQISGNISKTTQQNSNAEYENHKGNAEKFREDAKAEAARDRDNNIYAARVENIDSDINAFKNFNVDAKKQTTLNKTQKADTAKVKQGVSDIDTISELGKSFNSVFSWREYLRSLGLSDSDIDIKAARANMKK